MRKCFMTAMAAFVLMLPASTASAQGSWAPLGGRFIFSLNGAAQTGSQDLTRNTTFTLYDEQATVDFAQKIESGAFWDIGAAFKFGQDLGFAGGQFGVGFVYASLKSTENGSISGSLPHPLFFDRPRTFTAAVENLEHKEQVVHVQAIWYWPFVEKVDFAISAGPSFFTTTQAFARGVQFSENPPSFNSVTIDSIDVATIKESSVGFNLGLDVTYAITPMIGAGAMMRFSKSSADFNLAEGQSTSLDTGGFQIGAGVRLKF